MPDQPTDPAPAAPTPPADPPAPADPAPDPAAPPAPEPPKPGDGLPDDPEALKKEILRLRGENASARTNAKAAAAEEARKALAADIGKALGLVEDPPADPAQLTAAIADRDQQLRTRSVQFDAYKAASGLGVNADALLDSASFLAASSRIDPSSASYADDLAAAITAAKDTNPLLAAQPAAPTPGPGPAQGPRPTPGIDQQIRDAEARGDGGTAMRLKLAQLMGGQ